MINWGYTIKRLREAKGLTQEELAAKVGIKRPILSHYELGYVEKLGQDLISRFAKVFEMTPSQLSQEIYGGGDSSVISNVELDENHNSKKYGVIRVPIYGYVPAGKPIDLEGQADGYVIVCKEDLGMYAEDKLFSVCIRGESLAGDNIHDGDKAIVTPNYEVIDGKLYIVKHENKVVLRHVYKSNNHLRLVAANPQYEDIEMTDCQLLGRVILVYKSISF